MNTLKHLTTAKHAREAVAASGTLPHFIFKHSTHCGISSRAIREFEDFMATVAPGFAFCRVDVIESRMSSDELELLSQVRHESPQVLLMWNSACVWHASHGRIKSKELHLQAEAMRVRLAS